MIASILRAEGHRVGLYTSPHLHSFCERITVDGAPISEDDFARLTETLAPQVAAENADGRFGELTTFELLTALAFLHFREVKAQWQVLEVGMGGEGARVEGGQEPARAAERHGGLARLVLRADDGEALGDGGDADGHVLDGLLLGLLGDLEEDVDGAARRGDGHRAVRRVHGRL